MPKKFYLGYRLPRLAFVLGFFQMQKAWTLFFALTLAAPAAASPLAWEQNQGKAEVWVAGYGQPLAGYEGFSTITNAETTFGLRNENWGFRFTPWASFHFPDDRVGSDARTKLYLEAKEGWAEYVADDWEVRAGNQILAWGTSDGLNPTDVWNAWDLTEPLRPLKLPSLAARLVFHPASLEHLSLEIIGVPSARVDRLPAELPTSGSLSVASLGSRWLQNIPTRVRVDSGETLPLRYEIEPATYPDRWEGGARLRLLRMGGWDFSASAAEVIETSPQVNYALVGSPVAPDFAVTARLTPAYYRMRSYGADAAGSWGPVGLRAEVAWQRPLPNNIPNLPQSTLFGVLGADYTFEGHLLGAKPYLNLAYVHKDDHGGERFSFTSGVPNLDPWDRDVMLTGELRWGTSYTLGARGIAGLRAGGYWAHAYFDMLAGQHLNLEIAGDTFGGNPESAFGQFYDNKRGTATVGFNW